MQFIQLRQQTHIRFRVVTNKARHRPLPAPHLARVHILRHQTGHRLPRIATDPLQVAQDHAAVTSPQGPIAETPQGLLNPVVPRILALDGKFHVQGTCQEDTHIIQAL